jgi:DNA polymerase I-like protein with 3'-5' exonuclease and polymerase domains
MAKRHLIVLPERTLQQPIEIPKSLQKKKTIKNIDSVIEECKKITEKYAGSYICIDDKDVLIDYIDHILANKRAGLDTETTGLDIFNDKVIGFSLFTPGMKACYIPMLHISRFTGQVDSHQLTVPFCAEQLQRLRVPGMELDYFNAPFDMNMIMYSMGVNLWDILTQDGSLMMRLLNTERHRDNNLKALHSEFCGERTRGPRFNELFPNGSFNVCPYRYAATYAARDAEMAFELVDYADAQLHLPENEGLLSVWETIERPLIPVLLKMRQKGVLVDQALRAELTAKYKALQQEAEQNFIHEYEPYLAKINQYRVVHGREKGKHIDIPVKIGSDEQIKVLFWDIMNLPHEEGAKADKEAINGTKSKIGEYLLQYRQCQKLLSTYLEGIEKFMQPDGCIHGGIKQLGADTGRTSACIAEGTLIEGPGESKPIEQVKVGDEVYTYDDAGNLCVRKVTRVLDNGYRQCLTLKWQSSGTQECGSLTCTPDHMIKTKDAGWVMSVQLKFCHKVFHFKAKETDTEYAVSGNYKIVSASDAGMRHVYDLEVEDTHCYIAGEICVHNCDPNMQNIPSHNREIRQMYHARPGCYLISCDYSAQEPRITASLSKDPKMIQAYKDGLDLYSMIAAVAYNTTYEECLEKRNGELYLEGKERRTSAKSIVLGICYGRSIPSIAEQLKCSTEEAQVVYDKVTKGFPGLLKAQDDSAQQAHDLGYVITLWGRRRHLSIMTHDDYEFEYAEGANPEFDPFDPDSSVSTTVVSPRKGKEYADKLNGIKWRKDKEEFIAELKRQGIKVTDYSYKRRETGRKCLNARIQGSAADMSKRAMIMIDNDERLKKINTYLLLMIHDEVICECPKEHVAEAIRYIKEDMEHAAAELPVPFKADAETAECWYGSEIEVNDEGEIVD